MEYTHNTYENTRESTDETLRYCLAVLTRNGINDVHQMVDWYNARINDSKEGREDATDMFPLASHAWLVAEDESDANKLWAWSVGKDIWETVRPFVKRTKRYECPSEEIPYSTRKLF